MTQPAREYETELEKQLAFYVDRVRQIDSLLEGPVQTLIRLAELVEDPERGLDFPATKVVYFPPWVSEAVLPSKSEHLMTWSLCSATLQRVWRMRRRFTWLEKKYIEGRRYLDTLEDLEKEVVATFTPKNPSDFSQCVRLLKSRAFGGLNPLTASQVFRVFLNSTEAEAHSGVGFLAFFAMLWALGRRFPDPLNVGAAIEPWEPSAYVTANCLLPIKTLQGICRRRARLLKQVSKCLADFWKPATSKDDSRRWEHSVELDELTSTLLELAELAIDRGKSLTECAKIVEAKSGNVGVSRDNRKIYEEVLAQVVKCLFLLGHQEVQVLANAEGVLKAIRGQIIARLTHSEYEKLDHDNGWGMRFAEEYVTGKHADAYWKDLQTSANRSIEVCEAALQSLKSAAEGCRNELVSAAEKVVDEDLTQEILDKFTERIQTIITNDEENTFRIDILEKIKQLANAYEAVAGMMEDRVVSEAAHWCRSVVDRQIAYASAGNFTDFDASELISGIAVAVRWNLMTTWLEVSDAVKRALDGVRPDGSWSQGQPFYSPDYATAISTRTSDIVWTLTSAIEIYPDVKVADDALFDYVSWLERTRVRVHEWVGWASDRLRHPRKIHLATTALSVNALLEIRDLAEYRLWELCKKRFPVVPVKKRLADIKPTDLGARHDKRLHGQIARMGRKAQSKDYESAEYSLVLHGPRGSSKTALAQALSAEMWKTSSRWGRQEPRLVRITPADFTRMGEDRVDAEAGLIFDLLSHVRGVTVFFDEIDDLLRRRVTEDTALRFLDLVVPAMLNRLADLRDACPKQEICFLLATNFVEKIEPALIRKGRIDRAVPVTYPDWESRLVIVREEGLGSPKDIAEATARWPYLEILSACEEIKQAPAERDQVLKRSAPEQDYRSRLQNPPNRELLNEYLHCRIAEAKDLAGCKRLTQKRWGKELERIWIDEGRPI